LEDIGLSRREAKVYLALLELGPNTVGPVVKRSGVPSSKIYEILDRLIARGLVSYLIIKHQKRFQAADPERVLSYLDEKRKKLVDALPELKTKQQLAKERQDVELYEGKQAIFSLMHGLVNKAKKGEEYLSFSVGQEHDDPEIARFYTNFTWRRKEKGLKTRVLTNEKARPIYTRRYPKEVLTAINNRFTPFNFPQGLVILQDKLIILNWKDRPTAIVITSKNITGQYRAFFYELYNTARL